MDKLPWHRAIKSWPELEWDDQLLVDNEIIDSQHKQLVILINKFFKAITAPDEVFKSEVRNAISSLILFSEVHFYTEFMLMKMSNYPDMAEHLKGHAETKAEIDNATTAFDTEEVNIDQLVSAVISLWAPTTYPHDRALAVYLKEWNITGGVPCS